MTPEEVIDAGLDLVAIGASTVWHVRSSDGSVCGKALELYGRPKLPNGLCAKCDRLVTSRLTREASQKLSTMSRRRSKKRIRHNGIEP